MKKKPKIKKLSLKREKAKAWRAFSLYIHLKEATKDGHGTHWIKCYTCGKPHDYKEMNAGHGIGGRNNAILFDERIVRPQCVGCNIWGRGQYQIFTRKLIGELGLKKYDEIVQNSSNALKYTALDYKDIAEKYREKLQALQGSKKV